MGWPAATPTAITAALCLAILALNCLGSVGDSKNLQWKYDRFLSHTTSQRRLLLAKQGKQSSNCQGKLSLDSTRKGVDSGNKATPSSVSYVGASWERERSAANQLETYASTSRLRNLAEERRQGGVSTAHKSTISKSNSEDGLQYSELSIKWVTNTP